MLQKWPNTIRKKLELKGFSESIKDHLISIVSYLSTLKEVYDTLVKLYSINTTRQKIFLRNQLYGTRRSKEDNVASHFMKISKFKDQFQGLSETIYDYELITSITNALPPVWDGFAEDIYARKETPTIDELWAS